MELDEFKAHWNIIQDKEFQQQKISTEKLELIIMNTTDTLSQLQSKSIFWNNLSKITNRMLLGLLAAISVIIVINGIYQHNLAGTLTSFAYLAVIALYCVITLWVFKRQEQIFTIYHNDNVKATLKHTIKAFKRFYLMMNAIYLFLYPAYFYAVIKVMIPYWHASQQTVLITCAALTVLFLLGGHWYHKVKFFPKVKLLGANLKELESQEV